MLTLYQFIAMNETEQADLVWAGVHLDSRLEGKHMIQLYSVSSFFVEVFYDPVANRIDRFRPFNSNRLLESYLKNIDIS